MLKRFIHLSLASSITTLLLLSCFSTLAWGQTFDRSQLPAGMGSQQVQQLIDSSGMTASQASALLNQAANESPADPSLVEQTESQSESFSSAENIDQDKLPLKENVASTPSAIEQLYQQQYNSDIAKDLQQYGYNIFNTSSRSISKLAVPSDNYLLGPGDKLRIRIWGNGMDALYIRTINRDGTIDAPKVGIIPVSGVRFGKVEEVLRREAEKYVQGININVSLEELRTIEIYVVGEVEHPGLHLVPAFSTVLDGLTAGAVKKSGSLRSINLLRKESQQHNIDLYSLLLEGSRQDDLPLKNGDVIFVPRLKRTAAIAGGAIQPAIYELLEENSVDDLLKLAGGAQPQTFTGKMILRRFINNSEFIVKDLRLLSGDADLSKVEVQNGDLLELKLVEKALLRAITLEGNVWSTELFSYHPGLKLSDVLSGPEMLKPESIIEFALLHHYNPQSTRFEIEQFPLAQLFAGQYDHDLQPFDRIEILSRQEYEISEPIQITGAVWRGSEYNFTPGLTLADIISMAGGFQFDADQKRIDLSRQIISDGSVTTEHTMLSVATDGDYILQPYDYIYVRKIKDAASFKSVSILGEVKYPGQYRIRDDEKLSSLIERAGGFTENAYFYGAFFTSEQARVIQQQSLDKMIDDLELKTQTIIADQVQLAATADEVKGTQTALTGLVARLRQVKSPGRINITLGPLSSIKNSSFDFELSAGDSLNIPSRPKFVSVLGSVYTPNSFLYNSKDTLVDYLSRAGGPTKTADEDTIYILKANGEVSAAAQAKGLFSTFDDTTLMPGDSIIVPEDLDRIPYMKLVTDVADIVFKIATTFGIFFVI